MFIAGALAASACGGDDDDAGGSAATATPEASQITEAPSNVGTSETSELEEEPTRGGSLTYLYSYETGALDPARFSQYGFPGDGGRLLAIYDALLIADPITGDVIPRIAESVTSDDGGATFTLVLSEGVVFSDGTAFDAAAVKFNWERAQDPEVQALTARYANMVSDLTVVDPLTLRFKVAPPNPQFARIVATYLSAIASPTAITNMGDAFEESPVGAGPFVVSEWVRDSHLTLVRNDSYWREGLPYLDEVVIRVVPDVAQRVQATLTGDAHAFYSIDVRTNDEAVAAGLEQSRWLANGSRYVSMNPNRPPFDNPLAVEAVKIGVDRARLVETVEGSGGVASDTIFLETSPLYSERGTLPPVSGDLERAQELLDQYAEETGGPLTFTMIAGENSRILAEAVQAELSRLDNIQAEIELMPTAEFITRTFEGEYQGATHGRFWVDPYPAVHVFESDASPRQDHFAIPELDDALKRAVLAEGEERYEAYADAQEIMAQDVPFLWLSRIQFSTIYDGDRVHNFTTAFDLIPRWDEIWLSP